MYLLGVPILWKLKLQQIVALSSTEAEYCYAFQKQRISINEVQNRRRVASFQSSNVKLHMRVGFVQSSIVKLHLRFNFESY